MSEPLLLGLGGEEGYRLDAIRGQCGSRMQADNNKTKLVVALGARENNGLLCGEI